jgi:hypothetical protein
VLGKIDAKPSPRKAVHLHPYGLAFSARAESTESYFLCAKELLLPELLLLADSLSPHVSGSAFGF